MLAVQSRGLRDDTFPVRALKGTSGRGLERGAEWALGSVSVSSWVSLKLAFLSILGMALSWRPQRTDM